MNDTFIFDDQLPDPEKYWDLFQTTGWNLEYNFSITDLNKNPLWLRQA